MEMQRQQNEIAQDRRTQVGTGERSEKIRTYNFPQNRVTDHRIGFTTHKLAQMLDGDTDEIFDTLVTHFQSEQLKETESVKWKRFASTSPQAGWTCSQPV